MITTTAAVERDRDEGGQVREESLLGKPAVAPQRKRKPWKPTGRDELIYQWVRLEGKTQAWVASAMEISQATVSRTLERYGKWQAHAQPGADGSLTRAERQRMQWQLTYERNERIVTSALRQADEMEHPRDMEKSVTVRPNLPTSDERQIRRESFTQDRSGMIARFLRLAFRVSMEQLKLVDHEPEPLAPLTEEEQAACAAGSAAAEAEVAAWDQQRAEDEELRRRINNDVQEAVAAEVERRLAESEESRKAASSIAATSGRASSCEGEAPAREGEAPAREGEAPAEPPVSAPSAAARPLVAAMESAPGPGMVPAEDATTGRGYVEYEAEDKTSCLKLHKVHNGAGPECGASDCPGVGCGKSRGGVENRKDACTLAVAVHPDEDHDDQCFGEIVAEGGACGLRPPVAQCTPQSLAAAAPRQRLRARQMRRLARTTQDREAER